MLGRFSKNLKVGLVGMPNVGKSTLYNSLSKSHHAEAANFPFCTIEPNETRAFMPDDRFEYLVAEHKPKSVVQPFLNVVDIAGLVRNASKGDGLGNAFLSHIKAVDGIIHVMRAFEDADIVHAEDTVDPVRDIECITTDLRSPWGSAAPSSVVNFFCWKMLRSASWVGAHVPRDFCRQKSFSVALMDTTTLRLSGFSGLATQ